MTYIKAENYVDPVSFGIYETDLITTDIRFINLGGVESWKGYLLSNTNAVIFYWLIDDNVDDNRKMVFTYTYACLDVATGATITGTFYVGTKKTDGTEIIAWDVENGTAIALPSDDDGNEYIHKYSYELIPANFSAGDQICVYLVIAEAGAEIYMQGITCRYHMRRLLS